VLRDPAAARKLVEISARISALVQKARVERWRGQRRAAGAAGAADDQQCAASEA
jgi:hypothetical protein